jgi:hypothetical protein
MDMGGIQVRVDLVEDVIDEARELVVVAGKEVAPPGLPTV